MALVFCFGLGLLILTSYIIHVDSNLEQYFSTVSDVHEYYGTSSVYFVLSLNNQSLEDYTAVHALSRDFSERYDFTSILHLDQLDKDTRWDHKQISQSLLVIFLRSLSDIAKFTGKYMRKPYIGLVIFTNDSGSSALCEYCKSPKGNRFGLRFDTEMLVVCCDSLVLKDWWSINGDDTEASDFAVWKDHNRKNLRFLAPAALEARRYDLKGTGLRIGLVKNCSFAYKVGLEIRGLFGDVLNELKRSMNFTISRIVISSAIVSWDSKTKKSTGAIRQLLQGETDIVVTGVAMTKARLNIVDYTLPLLVHKSKLYIRHQGDSDGVNWASYFQTFSFAIWIVTILLILLASALLAVIKSFKSLRSLPFLIVESHLHVWGIFCQQGLSEFPAETSLRIAYFSTFVLALVINAAYSASLVSFLAVSPSGLPFTTLEGFVNDGSYKLIVLRNSAAYEFFANSTIPVLKKMMGLMKPVEKLPETALAAWEQVCDGKVALYSNELLQKITKVTPKCKVATVDSGYEEVGAMIMPRRSQYSSVINYHIQRFKEMGVMRRMTHTYFDSEDSPTEAKFNEFSLWNVAPVLVILILGLILALLVLLGEVMCSALKTNLHNRRLHKNARNLWKARVNDQFPRNR